MLCLFSARLKRYRVDRIDRLRSHLVHTLQLYLLWLCARAQQGKCAQPDTHPQPRDCTCMCVCNCAIAALRHGFVLERVLLAPCSSPRVVRVARVPCACLLFDRLSIEVAIIRLSRTFLCLFRAVPFRGCRVCVLLFRSCLWQSHQSQIYSGVHCR